MGESHQVDLPSAVRECGDNLVYRVEFSNGCTRLLNAYLKCYTALVFYQRKLHPTGLDI